MKRQAKLNICLTALCCLLFITSIKGSERDSLFRFSPTPMLETQTNISGELGGTCKPVSAWVLIFC